MFRLFKKKNLSNFLLLVSHLFALIFKTFRLISFLSASKFQIGRTFLFWYLLFFYFLAPKLNIALWAKFSFAKLSTNSSSLVAGCLVAWLLLIRISVIYCEFFVIYSEFFGDLFWIFSWSILNSCDLFWIFPWSILVIYFGFFRDLFWILVIYSEIFRDLFWIFCDLFWIFRDLFWDFFLI